MVFGNFRDMHEEEEEEEERERDRENRFVVKMTSLVGFCEGNCQAYFFFGIVWLFLIPTTSNVLLCRVGAADTCFVIK